MFYSLFILMVYSFYQDGHGLALALGNFIFRSIYVYCTQFTQEESNSYIISHVYMFMATLIPIFLGSKYIVTLFPAFKAKFPAG